MNQMNQQTNRNNKEKGYGACCAVGCVIAFGFLIFIILVIHDITSEKFGENMATPPTRHTARIRSPEKGRDFCYYTPSPVIFPRVYMEFTISEQDFLDWGKSQLDQWWEPLEIKSLPLLARPPQPDRNNDDAWPAVNEQQGEKIPLLITRYIFGKEGHRECRSQGGLCHISPTGKTDSACFCFVEDGYYFQARGCNGGGYYILYDREKQRCYLNYHSN